MIKNIIEAAHANNIWVGMCGEMASDEIFALVLLGLGLDEFSMPSLAIPQIKYIIRSVTFEQAKNIAKEALTLSTAKSVESFMQSKLKEISK
jgi:phosphotransferase system enzyme I (PtsI)